MTMYEKSTEADGHFNLLRVKERGPVPMLHLHLMPASCLRTIPQLACSVLLLLFLCGAGLRQVYGQPPAFYKEVQAFKKLDSISFPATGQILLIGSSSFTYWKDAGDYFPGYSILNRAFGGSTLKDVIYYAADVIYPYAPRQILIYCGENDFAASDTVSVSTVVGRFKTLFQLIRNKYPRVPVAYVSMKPSPSRRHLMPVFREGNAQIKAFLSGQKRTAFIPVFDDMLRPDGTPMPHIFKSDSLHMNAAGYDIWQKRIQPFLRKK